MRYPAIVGLILVAACSSSTLPEVPREFAAWGDSFTNDTQLPLELRFPGRLSALLDRPVIQAGVAGETSSQTLVRILADTKRSPAILWMGHNDQLTPDVIRANVRQAVQSLSGKDFIVLALMNGDYQPEGTEGYSLVLRINNQFASDYPANYIDIRSAFARGALLDIPPAEYRRDARHLNAAGYDSVAHMVAHFIEAKGW